ncbi:MAG: poly(A)-specific ribonuclease [Cirrosporium novae-zelandiae]|nr:MAG: poly(A)-specific ribonuclease [Cirrosporium novae-zelandiae]
MNFPEYHAALKRKEDAEAKYQAKLNQKTNPVNYKQICRIVVPPPGHGALPTNATTIAFDTQQELLWAGNEWGRVTSFCGSELSRYTSVKAHPEGVVRQFLFHDLGVLSVSASSVHLTSRRGLTQWHIISRDMQDLRCMTFLSPARDQILVAGGQPEMFVVDIEKGEIVDTVQTAEFYTLLRFDKYICAATTTGTVNFLDPKTFDVVKTWKAHAAAINDMDARNGYLVTCGYSPRQIGSYMFDPMANVYDVKKLVPLVPIPFPAGAAFVRLHPKMQTTCIVASQGGQLQVVDIMNPNTSNLRQADITTYLLSLELAPSGEALALADGACAIHLWGSPSKIHFAEVRNHIEFAEDILPPELERSMDLWTGDLPLNSIGMPYYSERLLSAWPGNLISEVGNPPPGFDPKFLATLIPGELGLCGPYSRKTPRYQKENTRSPIPHTASLAAPKFLSEKARENGSKPVRRMSDAVETLLIAQLQLNIDGLENNNVPPIYQSVEIKYSKFGVDDFDFAFYNKTSFSGLETHIANSYTNPLLQLLKFTPLFRNLALHHAASTCLQETCLLCEMGFLFDMLEKANGQSCQATNLLKTFSSFQDASQLGLLEENLPSTSISHLIQSVCRFFMQRMKLDYDKNVAQSSQFENTFTIEAMSNHHCTYCRKEQLRADSSMVTDLIYAGLAEANNRRITPSFAQILKSTLQQEIQSRAFCENCKTYRIMTRQRMVQAIPSVLMLNAHVTKPTEKALWARPNWLPQQIGVILTSGQVYVVEGEDIERSFEESIQNMEIYDLVGVVVDVNGGDHQRPHLVSLVDVAIASEDHAASSQFHLFNDFLVRPIPSIKDALDFTPPWKTPCILTYQVRSARHALDHSWKDNLDTTMLYYEWSMNNNAQPCPECRVLNPEVEAPHENFEAAIDTEFVTVERAEIDVRPDGSQEVIRPKRQGLARVSVLRGAKGPETGTPFIDDYIAMHEPIVDYVTEYSGIKPGDLDVHTSSHNLVPLKIAYKKLWLLLNMGCIFIGHGLSSDFRQINIHVPPNQFIDTQRLYHIPAKARKLSLRFCAWSVLREHVQEGGREEGHDSIEDARTALRLWRKFEEVKAKGEGEVEKMLEEVYREGVVLGFKPPPSGVISGRIGIECGNGSRPVTPSRAIPIRSESEGKSVDLLTGSPRQI